MQRYYLLFSLFRVLLGKISKHRGIIMYEKEERSSKKVSRQSILEILSMDTQGIQVSSSYERKNYVDQKKMSVVKEKAYNSPDGKTSKTMIDSYTGEVLHRDRDAAVNKYGEGRKTHHSSQTDHTVPLENIYDRHKNSAWLTDNDIRQVANSDYNLKEISTHANEQKKSDSNFEYVKKHWDEMSKEECCKRLVDGAKSDISVEAGINFKKAKNIGSTAVDGAKRALIGAAPSLIHQGAKDIAKIKNGDMNVEEALDDMLDSTEAVIKSGMVGSVVKHQAEHIANQVSQKVINKTLDANAIGKVTGIAISLKDCTEKYINGEIDSREYCIEVLEDSVGFIISELGFAVGGFLGGPFCAACCSYVLSTAYDSLISLMRESRFSEKRQKEMMMVVAKIKKQQEQYRHEFTVWFSNYYNSRESQIDVVYNRMIESIRQNNVNDFLFEINRMGDAFGIHYELVTFEKIDQNMQDENFVFEF